MKTIKEVLKELDCCVQEVDLQFVGLKGNDDFPERRDEADFSAKNAEAFRKAGIQLNPNGTSGELVFEQKGNIEIAEVVFQLFKEFPAVVCLDRFRKNEKNSWTHHLVLQKESSEKTFKIPDKLFSDLEGGWKGIRVYRNVKIGKDGNPYLSLGVRLMHGRPWDFDKDEIPKKILFKDGNFGVRIHRSECQNFQSSKISDTMSFAIATALN